MQRTITTFMGGMILGVAAMAAAGHVAVFERPEPPVAIAPPLAQAPGQPGIDVFTAAERRIPVQLQACVMAETEAQRRRHQEIMLREMAYGMDQALGRCLARQKSLPAPKM